MTGYVTTGGGERIRLPAPLSWRFQYTTGVPCDSFQLRCLWDGSSGARPEEWAGFQALQGDQICFTGVVDECETVLSGSGAYLEVSGRGMAARLLDNEAMGEDYELATLEDILRDHVIPYGVDVGERGNLSPVERFSVATGSSEWAVVYDFARYYNGICPRFDARGRLVLTPWTETGAVLLDDGAPVTELVCRDRRYGVLSQVIVRDRYQAADQTVSDRAFQAQGGRRRQIFTVPGRGQYQAMRYSGQFQLEQSARERLELEITVPQLFFAGAGELVRVERSDWGRGGLYRVAQAQVSEDETGGRTQLTLVPAQTKL